MNLNGAIYLTVLVVSISLLVVLAKGAGARFPLHLLVVLTVINLAGLGALAYLLLTPEKTGISMQEHEARVYAFLEAALQLGLVLLLLLPPMLALWFVRLRAKR